MGLYKGESFTEDEYKNINAATGKPFGQAGEEAVQNKAQEWRNQGSPVPGTKQPEDIRSLGQQIIDWSGTPAGNATLGGLGLLAAAAGAYGLSKRKTTPEAAPKVEPYVSPSFDYETTATEVPERKGLPQPSTPVAEPTPTPTPNAPTSPTVAPAGTTPVATQQPAISGYGQQTLNAPTGAPSPIAPPTVAPVEPKPMSDLEKIKLEEAQIRLQATKDKAAFDAQVREKKLESLTSTAKKSVEKQQKGGGGLSPMDKTILNNQITAAAASDVKDTLAKKAAVPPAPATTAAPVVTAPQAVAPVAPPATPATPELETALGKPTVTTGSGMPAYAGQGGESAKMKKEFGSIADVPKGYVFVPGGQYMDITRNAVGQEAFTAKLGEFGGYPLTQGQAYEQSRNINKSLGRPSYIEAKAAGVEPEPTKSITKSVGGSKLVKVAGVGGALISLANVANAKEAAQTVGEMLLPIGATPSEVQPGTLTEKQLRAFAEAQKLGSPFRSVPPPR